MKNCEINSNLISQYDFTIAINRCVCIREVPIVVFTNLGAQNANVEILTPGGYVATISNVSPGASMRPDKPTPAGQTTFTISVNNHNYVKNSILEDCHHYAISIDSTFNIDLHGVVYLK